MTDLDFTMNGCTIGAVEPAPFLNEAHGVLACIDRAIRDDGGPPNDEIVAAAVRGARSLIAIAGLALARCEKERMTRREHLPQ